MSNFTTPPAQQIYATWERDGATLNFDQLTPAQQAQAREMFHDDRVDEHTYSLRPDGTVHQWRFFKSRLFENPAVVAAVLGKPEPATYPDQPHVTIGAGCGDYPDYIAERRADTAERMEKERKLAK